MTIKTTRWSPDTCGCIINYSWDDATPEDSRTHTLSNIVKRCPAHQQLSTNQAIYDTVTEENPRKNIALKEILDHSPAQMTELEPESGRQRFKKDVDIKWSWSGTAPNRTLTMNIQNTAGISLTNTQKNTVRSILNSKFGNGKVILQ